jgi:hypothetical protein
MYYKKIIKNLIYIVAFVKTIYGLYMIIYNNILGFFVFMFSILIYFILFVDKLYNENNIIIDEEQHIFWMRHEKKEKLGSEWSKN